MNHPFADIKNKDGLPLEGIGKMLMKWFQHIRWFSPQRCLYI